MQTKNLTYLYQVTKFEFTICFYLRNKKELDEIPTPVLVSGQQLSSLTVGFSETRAVGRSENPGGSNIKVVGPPA